jgi:hypothetical protein
MKIFSPEGLSYVTQGFSPDPVFKLIVWTKTVKKNISDLSNNPLPPREEKFLGEYVQSIMDSLVKECPDKIIGHDS